jgi:glycosyltransferase
MKLSVVTVCLNAESTISYTIESFLNQRYPHKELLIIDGLSRDRTVDIARSFKSGDIHVLSEKDAGIYDAMNKGLRSFTGDAVGFLGADDAFHNQNTLSLLADGLAEADVVYGDLYVVTDQINKRIVRTYRPGPFHPRAFQRGWMPPHTTFYVRRQVVEKVGSFETRYKIGADYDYTLRVMALNNFRTEYIRHALIDFGLGGVSSKGMRSWLRQNLDCLDSRRRHLGGSLIDAAFFLKWARSFSQLHWRPRRKVSD